MEEKIDIFAIQQKVDFRVMLRDILRQWWMILFFSLSAAMATDIVVNELYVPRYTATTTLYVTSKGVNNTVYTDISTTSTLAEELSYVLSTSVMERKVAKELGMEELDAEVTVEQASGTNMLTITVTADTAVNAFRVINCMIDNYDTVTEYVLADAVIDIIQAPVVPASPSNSVQDRKLMEEAFLAAAVIVILLTAFASWIRDTVKNEYDFKDKIDAALLGVICHEKKGRRFQNKKARKKDSMLITNPLRSFRYVETYKMAASQIRSRMEQEGAKVLLVTSVIENEGKSTVAANLALALAQERKNVVLIDCDFRKPAQYKIFQMPKEDFQDVPKVLKTGEHLSDVFSRDMTSGLYTVFNATPSSGIENISDNVVFKRLLDFCRGNMDYVLIDASPMAMVAETEELAQMSNATVLVVKRDLVLTADINDAIDALNNTNGQVLGCIFNDAAGKVFSSQGSGYSSHYGYGGHYGKRA